ncbi:hypothetical protein OSTOST_06803 [Ostertagia ostertagi]
MLNMVISAHIQSLDTPLACEILRYLYVDNVLMTAHNEEKAVQKNHESKKLFAAIGMNLRSFISNASAVNAQLDESTRQSALRSNETAWSELQPNSRRLLILRE